MNEEVVTKDFRPHLSSKEIQFLLEVVKFAERFLDSQEEAYKRLETKLYQLRREVRIGNTMVWKELKQAKEESQKVEGYPMWILQQRSMLRSLKRRLESILNGGRAHRHVFYDFNLERALPQTVEPKTPKKPQLSI